MNNSQRGRGTNQYAVKDKQTTPEDLVRKAELESRTKLNVNASTSALTTDRITDLPDHLLVGQFSQEIDNHLRTALRSGRPGSEAASRETLRNLRSVSRYEDAVMTNHPDAYGNAMIEGVYWSKQVQLDPELRKEIRQEGSIANRRHAAFLNILRDADVSSSAGKLTVDSLADNLDELYLTAEGTDAWGGGISDLAKLQNRYAAASALAQREKNTDRRKALLDQAQQIKATLSERGIARINL